MKYSNEFKKQCIKYYETHTREETFEKFKDDSGIYNLNSFKSNLGRWKNQVQISEPMKDAATLGFDNLPTNATVQMDADGNIKQAWVRSKPNELDGESIVCDIIKNQKPIDNNKLAKGKSSGGLLEISFDDMHFGVAFFEDYKYVLEQTCGLIESSKWECILIPFGADLLHCDNFKGETGNGTYLGEIDYRRMWEDAIKFYRILFNTCEKNSQKVVCYYTQGNHSPCSSWNLLQLFKSWYPKVEFDDSMGDDNLRKAFAWNGILVLLTHGDTTKSGLRDLKELLIDEFKELFARATTTEMHSSHFHHEISSKDMNGFMARRLSSGVKKDKYSLKKGFSKSSERFQVFEYDHNYLKSIHYINRVEL